MQGKLKCPYLTKFTFPTMVIFIKVKDNVKNKPNNQFAATFFFQYKTYGGKITYRQGPGGGGLAGPQCLNFSNFAFGAKFFFAIQCVGKNKEFTWESNFSTKNFVIQLRAKKRSGVFQDPPSPQRVKFPLYYPPPLE